MAILPGFMRDDVMMSIYSPHADAPPRRLKLAAPITIRQLDGAMSRQSTPHLSARQRARMGALRRHDKPRLHRPTPCADSRA